MNVQLMMKIILWSLHHLLFMWYCVHSDTGETVPECPETGWICQRTFFQWEAISNQKGTEGVKVTFDYPKSLITINCSSYRSRTQLRYPQNFLQHFSQENITNYRFMQCPPPENITIAEVLGDGQMEDLRWTTAQPIGDSLDAQIFIGLDKLKWLNLGDCGITSLPADFSSSLVNLSKLRLTNNNITHLPHTAFAAFKALVFLELGLNNIQQLTETFEGLQSVQNLFLYGNQMEQISRKFLASLPSLESLDLQDNHLVNLPSDLLHDNPSLKFLKLFKNHLQSIPSDFLKSQTRLVELDISDNPQLSSLPPTLIHNLTRLSKLNMNRCSYQKIPTGFFHSENLYSLSLLQLERNDLTELEPGVFKDLHNLISLDLSYNNLTEISNAVMGSLRKLSELQLSRNKLKSIAPLAFKDLHELKTLDLSVNNLTTIPDGLFEYVISLKELNLSYNNLSYPKLANSPFQVPQFIQIINLSHNKMKGLPFGWLLERVSLGSLDLSFNQIQKFNADACTPISESLEINLTNNNISSVDITADLLDGMAYSKIDKSSNFSVESEKNGLEKPVVFLGNNPFNCDCNAKNLLNYFWHQSRRHYEFNFDLDNLKCSSPSSLAGRSVASLRTYELLCEIHEDCPQSCKCILHALGNALEVNCAHQNLTQLPFVAPFNTSILHFENNLLTNLIGFDDPHWMNLREMYLGENRIMDLDVTKLPNNVTLLDLQGNVLTNLSENSLQLLDKRQSMQVLLQANPWTCNCNTKEFKHWITENVQRIGNVSNILCNATDRPIYMEEVCPPQFINTRAILILATVISLALAIGLATAGIGYYRYRHEIKVWLYAHRWCMWFVTENEIDRDKTFDAFVSFSQEDSEFVSSHLIPGLESGVPAYKVCIHHRDWLAGEWIPDQIVRSVQDSRRTIVILSKNFIRSVWGRLEFKAAHHQALQDRMNRIIIIVIGDVPPSSEMDPELKMYVKFNTYLKWDDPWFWQKLRYAMPHSPLSMPPKQSTLSTMSYLSSTITDQPRIPMSCINGSINHSISDDKLELVCT